MSEAQGQVAPKPQEGVDAAALARVWRCDETQVRKMARLGVAVKLRHGRYSMLESTGNYIVHLRELAAGRKGSEGKVDAVSANAELKMAQRRMVEIKIAEQEGRLISLPELETVWNSFIAGVRQLFLSFPSRARFDLPHLTAHDQVVLKRLASDMLAEFSTGKIPMPAKEE